MNKTQSLLLLVMLLLVSACSNNQKTKTSDYEGISNDTKNASQSATDKQNPNSNEQVHTVLVKEILPSTKYLYLFVEEGDEQFWIATISQDVKVDNTYYYKGGLLKTNFQSKEHDRLFERIYLVSNLVELNHGNTSSGGQANKIEKNTSPINIKKTISEKGSIKIAAIVDSPKKYEGKTVQISGVCTKTNAGIMDRNWIHVKDGSKDEYDLVITSDTFVPEGSTITMKATVTLNKDFGAGYKYDLLLENGILIKQH